MNPTTPTPLPFEFTVLGPPVSHRSNNAQARGDWKQRVRDAASARWGVNAPVAVPLRIVVIYYRDGAAVRIDTD